MTEREKTALIAGELSMYIHIKRLILHLKNEKVPLGYLPEVLTEIADELIGKELER